MVVPYEILLLFVRTRSIFIISRSLRYLFFGAVLPICSLSKSVFSIIKLLRTMYLCLLWLSSPLFRSLYMVKLLEMWHVGLNTPSWVQVDWHGDEVCKTQWLFGMNTKTKILLENWTSQCEMRNHIIKIRYSTVLIVYLQTMLISY